MGRKKVAPERYETTGINKVLDFEDIEVNATLSMVEESEGPSTSWRRGSQSPGTSKDVETQSNPASNPALEEHSAEDEVEETSLMEPEGKFIKHLLDYFVRLRLCAAVLQQLCENDHLSRADKILGLPQWRRRKWV